MSEYLLSILFGIIEGLTEFLPVSSTAHLRIIKPWCGISLDDPYWKMYDVVIQLGAIVAVFVYFRGRILQFLKTFPRGESGTKTLLTHPLSLTAIAFFVTAVPAFLLSKIIKDNLASLWVMGTALLIGGVVMWVVDRMFGSNHATGEAAPHEPSAAAENASPVLERGDPVTAGKTASMEEMSVPQAIWIGAVQVLAAVFPGTSRSMSTIAAGQLAGLTRPAALEFSFFVSLPTMLAATCYDLLKTVTAGPDDLDVYIAGGLSSQQIVSLLIGLGVSFLVAWAVIAWFMAWVKRHGFVPFAIYRILLGIAVLVWAYNTSESQL